MSVSTWAQRGNGLWQFISSGLVAYEIAEAPPNVRELFEDTFRPHRDLLAMTDELEDLAHHDLAHAPALTFPASAGFAFR